MRASMNRQLQYVLLDTGTDGESSIRVSNSSESPLDVLYKRQRIDDLQHEAGILFRQDFEKCGFLGVQAIDIARERVDGGKRVGQHDYQHHRRDRLHRISQMLGRRSFGMLVNVCALGYGLNEVEKRCALPRSSGLPLLQDGLERLAEQYRLTGSADGAYSGAEWLADDKIKQSHINK